jgi:hypothetical protein
MVAYSEWLGSGVAGAIAVGDDWDRPVIEGLRQNIRVMAKLPSVWPLGGSRNNALQHTAVIEAYDWLPFYFDGTEYQTGATIRARVEVRTANAATSVTPQVYNFTDTSVAVTGAACTASDADYSGSNMRQTLSFTPAVGLKEYRLRLTPSNNTHPVYAIGFMEVFFP